MLLRIEGIVETLAFLYTALTGEPPDAAAWLELESITPVTGPPTGPQAT
jgi:hypothetical protein